MVRSIYTAATGMEAQQLYMDTISHNLSNVNTTGYKRVKMEFQDLMYQSLKEPGTKNAEGTVAPTGIEVGLGVRNSATQRIFEQGSLNATGNPYDIAISGNGFYQVSLPDGNVGYTRDGGFKLSSDGTLVTSSGYKLEPQIVVPDGGDSFSVDANGLVTAILPGEQNSTEIGQIELARFINPAGLRGLGENLYGQSDSSGEPIIGTPGLEGMGTTQSQYIETSNVQMIDEMVNMITAQRAYEIVSKAISVSEEMMQTANNLKR